MVPLFRCSHSLALYCWRGGIFDGGSVFNIGCRLRAYAVADAAARKEVSHACTRSLLRLHKESPLITKNGCVITEGAASGVGAHTAVAMAWRTPSRWRRWRMDNPLARPRFDHFHSLFSPQPPSRTLPLFLALLPGKPFPGKTISRKYNFSPLGSCRRHRTPFCVSLGVTVMMCVIIVVFVT